MVYTNFSRDALFAGRQMGLHNQTTSKALARLSSGYRINTAADDPAGLSISEKMRAQISMLQKGREGVLNGIDQMNTVDSTLAGAHKLLERLHELTVQAASGTLNEEERARLQQEAEQLQQELWRISGAAGLEKNAQLGLENLSIEEMTQRTNAALSGQGPPTPALPGLVKLLREAGLESIDISTQAAAQKQLAPLKEAMDKLSQQRGELGAATNASEALASSLDVQLENLQEAESRIRDVDMAKEVMHFARGNLMQQAAQAMLAHVLKRESGGLLELLRL